MEYRVEQRKDKNVDWKEHEGKQVMLKTKDGKVVTARVKIRAINCGKSNCNKCPHRFYAYAQYRDGQKIKQKYLGIAR